MSCRTRSSPLFALALMLSTGTCPVAAQAQQQPGQASDDAPLPGGQLRIIPPGDGPAPADIACPLEHTDVDARVSGFIGRVTVAQRFRNPTDQKIEAIYVFPLPQDAAVDSMVMRVGDRRVVGSVKERGEARAIYEQARAAGHVAGLLDQERPNIFTQSVANIEPGATVQIEISYVETLRYEDGVFEWTFPMVVGPRYNPGGGSAPAPGLTGRDTPQVPDGGRITPPVTPEGTRAGHDISLRVHLDPGLEVHELESALHAIDTAACGCPASGKLVSLKNQATIPNKDFILRYRLAGEAIDAAMLTHDDERGSFFTLVLQPPERIEPNKVVARELIFVLDTSGSMSGFPIEKAKQVMARLIDTMRDGDTFNLITFAGHTRILWDAPRPNTKANRAAAQEFLTRQRGGGGTEMMKAIEAALVQTSGAASPRAGQEGGAGLRARRPAGMPAPPIRIEGGAGLRARRPAGMPAPPIRIVCFMTDGYVGNDMEIIDAVRRNADTTRVFSFGIGNSVNRFLLDGMAAAGRGEVEYVHLASQADEAVARFHERVLAPVLTDIEIDWSHAPVAEAFPRRVPDLFSAKPILVHGRLTGPVGGWITVRGNTGAGPYERTLDLSAIVPTENTGLASLWARSKVEHLMRQDYAAAQRDEFPEALRRQVIDLGVSFGLLTQFTSFVAVEEMTVTSGGEAITVQVPVEMPEGVSYEGVFGLRDALGERVAASSVQPAGSSKRSGSGGLGGLWRASAQPRSAPPPSPPLRGRAGRQGREWGGDENDEAVEAGGGEEPVLEPPSKLHASLRGLAERVARDGVNGSLSLDGLKVVDWRVDVMVRLRDLSDGSRQALTALGFQVQSESRTVALLIGSIDVRRLSDLVGLEQVVDVRPLKAASSGRPPRRP